MLEKRWLREARLAGRCRGELGSASPQLPGAIPGAMSSPLPSIFPIWRDPVLPTCHLPNWKTPLHFFAAREVPAPHESNLTFNCVFAEVGEGHCPLLDLTQVPQPHGLNPWDLAGGTGTKQLLFCQTPLDKCSTFNNKLCKPNAKQFLASKLDFL